MQLGRWKDCWLVVIVSAATRLAVLVAIPLPDGLAQLPDSAEYDRLGRNLVEQSRFSLAQEPPWTDDLTRTPVYPVFVAGCYTLAGPHPVMVAVAQLVLGVGNCLLVYWIGGILFGRRVGVVAAILLALDPLSARYSALLLSETLFTTLFLAALLLTALYHRRPGVGVAAALGVCLGLAVLCRPIAIFWPMVVAGWMAGSAVRGRVRQAVAHGGLVIAIAAGLTGVWVVRNYVVGELPVLSTIPGINLYYHRAAAVVAQQEQIGEIEARERLATRLREEVQRKSLGPREEYRLMQEWGLAIIGSDGGAGYLRASWKGFVRMMEPQEAVTLGSVAVVPRPVEFAYLLLLYTLAVSGIVRNLIRPPSGRAGILVLLLGVAYFAAISGPEAYARFRVPVMPLIALLAGSAIRRLDAPPETRPDSGERVV